MNTLKKRFIAFLLLCIPVRLIFVYVVKKINKKYLPYIGYIGIIIGLGFMYHFILNKSRGRTFNQISWWGYLRPIHSILYFTFAYLAINENQKAYIPLLLDVIIGLIFFLNHHYSAGSFKKLF